MLIVLYPLFHHLLSIAIRMQNHTFFNTYMNSWQCNTALGNSPQFWTEAWAQQKHAAPSHVNIFYPQHVHVGSNVQHRSRSSVQSAGSDSQARTSSIAVFSTLVQFPKHNHEISSIVCCPLYCGSSSDVFAESEKSEIRICQGLQSSQRRSNEHPNLDQGEQQTTKQQHRSVLLPCQSPQIRRRRTLTLAISAKQWSQLSSSECSRGVLGAFPEGVLARLCGRAGSVDDCSN